MSNTSPWVSGLTLRCPQCGKGGVFSGYLKFRDSCAVCGVDFKSADAGDGPAVFVILIVGGMLMALLGFIGIYVGYIFQEVKRRPVYLIKGEKKNE